MRKEKYIDYLNRLSMMMEDDEQIKETEKESEWVEEIISMSLKHKYLTKNGKKLYLNISWDNKELTVNFNNYTTREWKAFFSIDEIKELNVKYEILHDFELEAHTIWKKYKYGKMVDIRVTKPSDSELYSI